MTDLNHFLIQIKNQIPVATLNLHLSKKFGASEKNHRLDIRQDIVDRYGSFLTKDEIENTLNLELRPTSKNIFFSISHCSALGGYAVCDQKIGFDIEEKIKIKKPIVSRVSSLNEMKLAPQYEYLWVAKEALFKVHQETKLISNINIEDWAKSDIIRFESKNGFGFLKEIQSQMLLSIAFEKNRF